MKFREALQSIEGLRTILDRMDIRSGVGRRMLMEQYFLTDAGRLKQMYAAQESALEFISRKENTGKVNAICGILKDVNDIGGTLSRLEAGIPLDEVELFEIKNLCMAALALHSLYEDSPLARIETLRLPDLRPPMALLDPEQTGNSHFHVYDAYSPKLAAGRKALKRLQGEKEYDEEESGRLTAECMALEAEVMRELTARLRPHAPALREALEAIGEADVMLAKARLTRELELTRPTLAAATAYRGLRYIPVELALRERKKEFQPVDIDLPRGVTVITGANMGGKTITLKSVAMAQALAQFGFYVPAREVRVCIMRGILQSMADGQSEEEGLSSFGAEILRLDEIVAKASDPGDGDTPYLIIIDEPGRTTNPEEGAAIAGALVEMLGATPSTTLLTTHYGKVGTTCRRIRVKGLKDTGREEPGITLGRLRQMMDYSLVEHDGDNLGEQPREALAIARLLGIGERFASGIESIINKTE